MRTLSLTTATTAAFRSENELLDVFKHSQGLDDSTLNAFTDAVQACAGPEVEGVLDNATRCTTLANNTDSTLFFQGRDYNYYKDKITAVRIFLII